MERISALKAPAGVTLLDDLEETVLATVTQPTRVEDAEAAPAEGEAPAEGAEGEAAEAGDTQDEPAAEAEGSSEANKPRALWPRPSRPNGRARRSTCSS